MGSFIRWRRRRYNGSRSTNLVFNIRILWQKKTTTDI
jgi:hypothetical protein